MIIIGTMGGTSTCPALDTICREEFWFSRVTRGAGTISHCTSIYNERYCFLQRSVHLRVAQDVRYDLWFCNTPHQVVVDDLFTEVEFRSTSWFPTWTARCVAHPDSLANIMEPHIDKGQLGPEGWPQMIILLSFMR